LPVHQQILKTFCFLQITDFFDTFLLELELALELEPEPPKLKSLEPEPPKWAAPRTLATSTGIGRETSNSPGLCQIAFFNVTDRSQKNIAA